MSCSFFFVIWKCQTVWSLCMNCSKLGCLMVPPSLYGILWSFDNNTFMNSCSLYLVLNSAIVFVMQIIPVDNVFLHQLNKFLCTLEVLKMSTNNDHLAVWVMDGLLWCRCWIITSSSEYDEQLMISLCIMYRININVILYPRVKIRIWDMSHVSVCGKVIFATSMGN